MQEVTKVDTRACFSVALHYKKNTVTKYNAKDDGLLSYAAEYPQHKRPNREIEIKDKWVVVILCLSQGRTLFTVLREVFFARLDQKTSHDFQCRTLHHKARSFTVSRPFLRLFVPIYVLATLLLSQAGTQTRLMNNQRKDAVPLLRENKRRCMSCVKDFSEWDLDQSSTRC